MKRRSSDSNSQRYTRRGKRVKFTDNEDDDNNNNNNPLSFIFDASSVPLGAMKSTKRLADNAKTSEFAFFKKLKDVAGRKFASHSERNELINQSNKFRLRNTSDDNVIKNASSISEKTNVVNNGNKDIRSSLLVENATPVRFVSLCSSPLGSVDTPNEPDAHMKKARVAFDDVQQRPQDMEEYSHPFRPQGTQYGNAEIFSIKRHKLCQWVRDISFPEGDGLNLKGHDIVFKLLSRLIPESKDSNNLMDQRFGQMETDADSVLAANPDTDFHCKNLRRITKRASTEHEFRPNLGDDIPYYQSNGSRGSIFYLDDPFSHDNTTNHWHRVRESDSLRTNSYSHYAFPLRRFSSVEPVEELGKICQPNRYLVESSLNTPMLSWEFDDKKSENNLSISFQDLQPITYPTSLIPWVNENKIDGQGLFSLTMPSIRINEEPEGPLPLSPHISSYNSHEYGNSVLEAEENQLPDSDNIPLAVSCRKSYFSPIRYPYSDTGFLNQDHWLFSKIFSPVNHHSQPEALLPSGLILGLDWKRFLIRSFPRDLYSSSCHSLENPTKPKPNSALQ